MVIISKYSNTVEYNLKTTLDASGISKLQAEIRKTQDALRVLSAQELIGDKSATKAIQEIQKLQQALTKSFNSRVGMLDMNKFTAELAKSKTNLAGLQQEFAKAGITGQTAFNQVIGRLGKLDTGVKSTSKAVDKIFNTIGNTVRWGIVSSAFNQMSNSVYKSVEYVKELNNSLTQIMLVTDYSRENMNDFAKSANEAAKNLGSTTTAMTNASLVFAQQGFNLDQSSQLAELSTKLANASQQDTATTSDQITAYMNAYGLDKDMNALHGAMDAWAQVANVSAADVAELAQASQKAASTANTVGVSMDQLNGQIATIESVTREAPEQIGNGLKTLYARFSDLEAGETLEDGISLGKVTEQLEKYGVQVLNGEGQMRGVGDIMEDLMDVWSSLDQTQKAAVAQTVAGKYQLSRFEALMNRSDLYDEYKGASENADGTLDQMNKEFVDSLEGRMNKLQATFEGIFNSMFETDDIYPFIDALTIALDLVDNFVQSIGGGGQVLLAFGNIATKVFSKQLAENIGNTIQAYTDNKAVKANSKMAKQNLESLGLKDTENEYNKSIVDFATTGMKYSNIMSDKQKTNFHDNLEQTVKLNNQVLESEAKLRETAAATNLLYQDRLETKENMLSIEKDKDGNLSWKIGEQLMPQFAAGTALGMEDAKAYKNYDLSDSLQGSINALGGLSDQVEAYIFLQKQVNEDNTWDKVTGNINVTRESVKKLCSVMTGIDDITAVKDLDKEMEDASQEAKEMAQAIQNFMSVTDITSDKELDVNKIKSAIEEIRTLVLTEQKAMEGLGKGNFIQNPEDLNRLLEMFNKAKIAADEQTKINAETQKGLELQAKLNNVIELTSAVGDLAFAWGSFQELGSLLTNDDLSLGEKALQLITNLAFTLPQLIMGIDTLNTAVKGTKAFSTFTTFLEKIIASAMPAAAGTLAVGSAAGAAGATTAGASTSVGLLSKALNLLKGSLGPAGLAFIAFSAIAGTVSFIVGQSKKDIENLTSAASEAAEQINNIRPNLNNFNNLYEGYKEGTVSSEQLKEAATALNDALDDQSAKALAAAGNWDAYAASVNKAAKEKALDNDSTLTAQSWQKEKEFAEKPGFWGINASHNKNLGWQNNKAMEYAWNQASSISNNGKSFGFVDGSSTADRIRDLENLIAAVQNELETATGAEEEFLQERLKALQTLQRDNSEAITEVKTAAQNEADNKLVAHGSDKEFQYQEGESLDEYKQRLMETGKFSSELAMEAFVNGMISGDFGSSKELAVQSAKEKSNELFFNNFSAKANATLEAQDDNPNGLYQTLENAGIDTTKYRDQISNALTQTVLKQVSESGLSPEDQQTLLNSIDWSMPIEDILGNITRAIDTGDISSVAVSSQTVEQDDTGEDAALQKYNVDENLVDTYTESLVATTDLVNGQKELRDNLAQTEKQFGENSDEAKAAKKELEDFDENSKDLGKDLIRTQKGLDALSESFEENYDILKHGDKTTLEYAEALSETKDTMADILNVSSEDISNSFIEENLDSIKALSEGSEDALNDLQKAFGQQYILDLNMSGNLTTQNLEILQNDLDNLNLTDIEVGASVNDQAFIDDLNNMLVNGEMTQKQVNTLLNGIGVEPHYTTEQHETTLFDTAGMAVSGEIFGIPYHFNLPPFKITGMVDVPQIKPADAPGGGGLTRKASPSAGKSGVRAPKGKGGGGGGKGGGGKGGGGGGKSYEPKENKDPIDNEVDRYERVNAELDRFSNLLEKITNEEERLTGDALLKNLEEQNKLLLKQIKLYQQKFEIQRQEALELQGKLKGFGITFDNEGFMSNYAQIHQQLIDEVNRLGSQYSGLTSEDAEKALDEKLKAAQKRLDNFEEFYEKYDELISSGLQETIQEIEDLEDEIEDLKIDLFKTSVEALDNIQDIQDALDKFNESVDVWFHDDPFAKMESSGKKLAKFFDDASLASDEYYDKLIARNQEYMDKAHSQETKDYYANQISKLQAARAKAGQGTLEERGTGFFDLSMSNLQDIMKEIKQFEETGHSDVFGENSKALYETAKDVFDQAVDLTENFKDVVNDLHDNIIDAIDYMFDEADKRMEAYDAITEELEHKADIVELIHGDKSYAQLNQALAAQQKNYKAQITELQQQLGVWKDLIGSMEKGSEEYEMLQEKIQDTQGTLNDLIMDSLENLRKQYENTISKITDSWSNNILGSDLDWMETEWELINRNADYYLDDVNKAYSIQKLQNKYLDLLDQSNDLAIQQKITAQMKEQLAYLKDKTKLSEYDVQYANAQLEILQKQIALEEAQRNKSQMKLRRDSQGNYSYVYAADQNNIRDAEGDLLDAQNNAYNMSKDQMQQTQADALGALTDAKALIDNIWNDANLSLEEKKKRTETVINSLKEYIAATGEQLSTSEKNIIQDFIGMMDILTDENKEGLEGTYEEIINGNNDAFDKIDTRWQTSISGWLENLDSFNQATDDMFDDLIDASNDYADEIDEVGSLVQEDFNDMSESIEETSEKTLELSENTADFISQLKDMAGAVRDSEAAMQKYRDMIADANNEMRAYQDQVNELGNKLNQKEQENSSLKDQIAAMEDDRKHQQNNNNSGHSGGNSGNTAGGNGIPEIGDVVTYTGGRYFYDSGGRNPSGIRGVGKKVRITHLNPGAKFPIHVESSDSAYGWLSKEQISGYDTGGYTGTWNENTFDDKNGKLAILHQKELILNAQDTENLLSVVNIVRDLTESLKSGKIATLSNLLGDFSNKSSNLHDKQQIEQNVHITAEFPAANSSAEIEAALLSLNDRAIQYSFKQDLA